MSSALEVKYEAGDDVPSGCSSLEHLAASGQTKLFYVSTLDNKFILNICSNDITTSTTIVKNDLSKGETSKRVKNFDLDPVWVKR